MKWPHGCGKKPEGKGFKISHGALVKKDAGKLNMEDSFAVDSAENQRYHIGNGVI